MGVPDCDAVVDLLADSICRSALGVLLEERVADTDETELVVLKGVPLGGPITE